MDTITITITVEREGRRIEIIRHKPKYTHLTIASSKPGKPAYDVVVTADFARCACMGYVQRGKCVHTRLGRELRETGS
jgi:hypothetical protein